MPTCPPQLARSVGGVVVDLERGLVLMREAAGHYGGTGWTPIAKGGADVGETDEQTALREVHEETGAVTEIVGELSGWWVGTTSATHLYVLRAVGALGPHDSETAAVRWVTIDEARELIALSPSAVVRTRDLAILDALVITVPRCAP